MLGLTVAVGKTLTGGFEPEQFALVKGVRDLGQGADLFSGGVLAEVEGYGIEEVSGGAQMGDEGDFGDAGEAFGLSQAASASADSNRISTPSLKAGGNRSKPAARESR